MAPSASSSSTNASVDKILSCPSLPSLPTVALSVLELTSNQNVKLDEIASVVQNDQALASKILKTINSSFYGLAKPCPTISRAVALLGLSTVKSLVLSFSLVDMTSRSKPGLDLQKFWKRNVYCATAARKLAMRTGVCDPEEAFLAGIMQDVAMLAMDVALGEEYRQLVGSIGSDHSELCIKEKEQLGFDHTTIGAKLAAKWRLAPEQIDAIKNHHRTDAAESSPNPLTRITIVAYEISRVLLVDDASKVRKGAERMAQDIFGLESEIVAAILEETEDDARALARQLVGNLANAPDKDAILERAEDARMEHQIKMQQEAEQLRQTAHDLEKQATTDALTGAGNRAMFDRELLANFETTKKNASSFGLILMDADKFKNLNDTYGHQVGDEVLVELSRRFREVVGEDGIVCRYGGEEFIVILPGANEQSAAEMAESLRCAIADAPVSLDEATHGTPSVPVTVSAGVAVMDQNSMFVYTRAELITQAADKSLYAAKKAGRNCVRVFRPRRPTAAA